MLSYFFLTSTLRQHAQESKHLESQIAILDREKEKIIREKQTLVEQIDEKVSETLNIRHGTVNVYKDAKKLRKEIHHKERNLVQRQNDIARLKAW